MHTFYLRCVHEWVGSRRGSLPSLPKASEYRFTQDCSQLKLCWELSERTKWCLSWNYFHWLPLDQTINSAAAAKSTASCLVLGNLDFSKISETLVDFSFSNVRMWIFFFFLGFWMNSPVLHILVLFQFNISNKSLDVSLHKITSQVVIRKWQITL